MNEYTRILIKSGYISCIISIFVAIYLMVEGLHFAGSEMVHTAMKTLVLALVIGFGIELNNYLK